MGWYIIECVDKIIPTCIKGKSVITKVEILDVFVALYPELDKGIFVPKILEAICRNLKGRGYNYYINKPRYASLLMNGAFYIKKSKDGFRICLKCGKEKPEDDFRIRNGHHISRIKYCRRCHQKIWEENVITRKTKKRCNNTPAPSIKGRYQVVKKFKWLKPWERCDAKIMQPSEFSPTSQHEIAENEWGGSE